MEQQHSFEACFAELQQVVGRLETGQIELDEMLLCFERGVQLIRQCRQMLDGAQAKILELVDIDEQGNARLRDFHHQASAVSKGTPQPATGSRRKSAPAQPDTQPQTEAEPESDPECEDDSEPARDPDEDLLF